MHASIYLYTYIHIHICVCVRNMCIYIYICICIHAEIHTHIGFSGGIDSNCNGTYSCSGPCTLQGYTESRSQGTVVVEKTSSN